MGLTPFLSAAGVGTGGRGTGLAASTSAGGAANMAMMDLLLQHGANINAQVTGTQTYSMRVSRAPSSTEGMTALHVAAQAGRTEQVKYLVEKGAKTDILDANNHKPVDLVGAAAAPRGAAPAPAGAAGATAGAPAGTAGAGRGGPGVRGPDPASLAEIRGLLQDTAAKK
jgi:hypothetical protein